MTEYPPSFASSVVSREYAGEPGDAATATSAVGRRSRPRLPMTTVRATALLLIGAIMIAAWAMLSRQTSSAILPGPGDVWSRFNEALNDGTYVPALLTTAEESILGWASAVVIAVPLGYALGRLRLLEDTLAPYLAGSQAMPVVAIAPLLLIWIGVGLAPKVVVAALISFFPVLATTASGIRGVPRDVRDAARVFGASWWGMAAHVDLPLAARTIFAGLKVAAALSVTGSVVGEFVSANQGLGYLITLGNSNYDTPLMFVGVLSLMVLGAGAYTVVGIVERFALRWDD